MIETTVPFYEFHEYRELISRTFRSLEEQLYLKKAQLKRQAAQHAAVLIPGQPVQLMKVASLRELPVSDHQCEEFRQACIDAAGCYKTPKEAEAELCALEEKLLVETAHDSIRVSTTARKPDVYETLSQTEAVKAADAKEVTAQDEAIWNRAQAIPATR